MVTHNAAGMLQWVHSFTQHLLCASHGPCTADKLVNRTDTRSLPSWRLHSRWGSHKCASCHEMHFCHLLEQVTFKLDLNNKEKTAMKRSREAKATRSRPLRPEYCKWDGEWRGRRLKKEAGTRCYAGSSRQSKESGFESGCKGKALENFKQERDRV